jgi:hypothetical protein
VQQQAQATQPLGQPEASSTPAQLVELSDKQSFADKYPFTKDMTPEHLQQFKDDLAKVAKIPDAKPQDFSWDKSLSALEQFKVARTLYTQQDYNHSYEVQQSLAGNPDIEKDPVLKAQYQQLLTRNKVALNIQ